MPDYMGQYSNYPDGKVFKAKKPDSDLGGAQFAAEENSQLGSVPGQAQNEPPYFNVRNAK